MNSIAKLIDRFELLTKYYEYYIWKHDDANLYIFMKENSIDLMLVDKNITIDEIILTFSKSEGKIYQYLCFRYMFILFGDVVIHTKDNEIFNEKHKPYFHLYVNDEIILNSMKEVIASQKDTYLNKDIDLLQNLEKDFTVINKIRVRNVLPLLDGRIRMSKKMLDGEL